MVTVYKNADSLKITKPDAKNGIVHITTNSFARDHYWNYFKSILPDYARQVPDLATEERLVYIFNSKPLTTKFEKRSVRHQRQQFDSTETN